MSKQHMKQVEKLKKAKKTQAISYLNFQEKVFFLDQILDHSFWSFHNSFLKTKYVPSQLGELNDFISIQSGLKISNLRWINKLDSVTPYQTGYQSKVWIVSIVISDLLVYLGKLDCEQKY